MITIRTAQLTNCMLATIGVFVTFFLPNALFSENLDQAKQVQTVRVGAGKSMLPAPNGAAVLVAENGRLTIVENGRHRRILEYARTLVLGWAPDGEHFFVNNEETSDRTELHVFDRSGGSHRILDDAILKTAPRLRVLFEHGSHIYIQAKRWIDSRSLEVEVSGHSDEAPVQEFDERYRVTLDGSVTAY